MFSEVELVAIDPRLVLVAEREPQVDGAASGTLDGDIAEKLGRRKRMAQKIVERRVTIAGEPFRLRDRDVLRAMRGLEPEPISSHFAVVGDRRFPPKQVISSVTGLDRADFTTHQARRTLMRLGFTVGRRNAGQRMNPGARGQAQAGSLGERLMELAGQWVAIKAEDVLHAADSPQELVGWLARHGQKADSVFRVPEDEFAATGLAPL